MTFNRIQHKRVTFSNPLRDETNLMSGKEYCRV